MKISYNIVWVDDKPEQMRAYIQEIEDILENYKYIPNTESHYVSYEAFKNNFENINPNNNKYRGIFYDCDLLLIDYNIAETNENEDKTGEKLIQEIRNNGIFTDVLFYSDSMSEYRKNPNRIELDNVVYADKSELVLKFENIVKRNVAKSMLISNLRGFLMDCTSDFDFICRTVSEFYFNKLEDDKQQKILDIAEGYIHEQFKNEYSKFKKINKKYKSSTNCCRIALEKTFKNISNKKERIKKLHDLFNSQENVILLKDKYKLMAQILRMNNIEKYSEIYDENETDKTKRDYNNLIIKHRNKLAHNKLKYGRNCSDRIKIIETLEDMDCTCSNNSCEKSYSYAECEKLRESIYEYYLLFKSLLEKVEKQKTSETYTTTDE
jgi:hypothetical protein